MKWRKLLQAALASILKNRMRSLLTMLGVIIGVWAVVVLVSLGQSAQRYIGEQIEGLGTNLLIVTPGSGEQGGVSASLNTLTLEDADALREQSTELAGVSAVVSVGAQVIGGSGNWSTQIQGVSPEYPQVRNWEMAEGSFFGEREIRARAKVAVLGQTVAEELFPGQNPVGAQIRIRNVPFRVIGVLAGKGGSGMGGDEDDVILAPVSAVLYRLAGGRNAQIIFASATSEGRMEAAEAEIREILRAEHRLREGEEDDFDLDNVGDIISFATTATTTLTLLLGAIAGISLVVGGIGIMNIMLVSVTERTREIGIRLAVGARGADVLAQFLIEAVVLSVIGGLIGTAVAFAMALLISTVTDFAVVVGLPVVGLAVGFSAGVGIFFGYYPARKAAALDPIEALRYE